MEKMKKKISNQKNNNFKGKEKFDSGCIIEVQIIFLKILRKQKTYNLVEEIDKEYNDKNPKINNKEIIPTISKLIYLSDI
jgi:hypothetical protein